jgi:hypothetical protein
MTIERALELGRMIRENFDKPEEYRAMGVKKKSGGRIMIYKQLTGKGAEGPSITITSSQTDDELIKRITEAFIKVGGIQIRN